VKEDGMTDPMQGGQPNQYSGQDSSQNNGQYQNNYGQYGQYPGYQGRPPRMSVSAESVGAAIRPERSAWSLPWLCWPALSSLPSSAAFDLARPVGGNPAVTGKGGWE